MPKPNQRKSLLDRAVTENKFVTRLMEIEDVQRGDGEDSRTIDVTWATEQEVRQWFGREVLVISKKSVDLSRMDNDQAPILYNHRTYGGPKAVLGVVENVRIEGKKCKGTLRFENHEDADIVYQGFQDGTRKQLSCGYHVRKFEKDITDPDDPLYRITSWQPFEVSAVAVGADPYSIADLRSERSDLFVPSEENRADTTPETEESEETPMITKEMLRRAREAGQQELALQAVEEEWTDGELGRALDVLEAQASNAEGSDAEPTSELRSEGSEDGSEGSEDGSEGSDDDAGDAEPTEEERAAEEARVSRIFAVAQEHSQLSAGATAINAGETVEAFTARILKENEQENRRDPDNPYVIERVNIEPKDLQNFRITTLIKHQIDGGYAQSPEVGIAQEEAKLRSKASIGTKGFAIPDQVLGYNILRAAVLADDEYAKRVLSAGVNASGGYTVDDELLAGSFIDILLEYTAATRLVTHLRDLEGDLTFPRQNGRAVASWTGEIEAAPEQTQTFDTVTMTPKNLRAFTVVSNQLLHQSSIDIEMFIRRDLARAVAKECDQSILNGSGTGNEPEGIDSISGINTVTSFDVSDSTTYFDSVLQAEQELADDNALEGRIAWVTEPGIRKVFRKTAELGTGTSRPIWYRNKVIDYPASVTTQCADNVLYLANWSEFLMGHWGGVDILVNPFSLDTTAQVRIVIYKMVDFANRHAVSFCKVS